MVMNKKREADSSHNEEGQDVMGSSNFPPGMAPKILNMIQSVEDLEISLEPLISIPHHEVLSKVTPLEKAKIGMLEAYTINSLIWVLMKTSKDNVDDSLKEDFKIEMGRLKEIQSRISEVDARERRPQVSIATASRLIHKSLGNKGRHKKLKTQKELPDDVEAQSYKDSWR